MSFKKWLRKFFGLDLPNRSDEYQRRIDKAQGKSRQGETS